MPRYVAKVIVETEFDEQSVRIELRPLRYDDALALRRHLRTGPDGKPVANEEVLVDYAAMLPRYLIGSLGLKDANGVDITLEDLSTNYFSGFVRTMLLKHMAAAKPPDPTLPAEPQDASSAGLTTENTAS